MSFWDSIKPAAKKPSCTALELSTDRATLSVSFDDGKTGALRAQRLRQLCPCAECVDEHSGVRTLDPASVASSLTVLDVASVGNYAVSFTFSDAHRTGIYQWEYLHNLLGEPRA